MMQSISDVSLEMPSLEVVLEVLTLRSGINTAIVVLGTCCLGIASGIIGTFALLRKRSMMGDALAHATLPGLAIAFILSTVWLGMEGKSLPVLLAGAIVSAIVAVIVVQLLVKYTRLKEDTAIGAVLSVFFGCGVVLMSAIQYLETGSEGGLHHFIYGQTAAMSISDACLIAVVAVVIALITASFLKEFRLICFDADYATVQGWPVSSLDLLMMALVMLVVVVGLSSVGMLLVIALLIIPASAARFWTERLNVMIIISALIGGLSCYLGASASALFPRMPAGAIIVLTSGCFFAVSFGLAPKRGVLASLVGLVREQKRVSEDHLLRRMFEFLESEGVVVDAYKPIPLKHLRIYRSSSSVLRWIVPTMLSLRGLVIFDWKTIAFTPKGLQMAKKLTINHRLWEEYLISYAHLSSARVDWSADIVEHIMSDELVARLKNALRQKGVLLADAEDLTSVHPLKCLS